MNPAVSQTRKHSVPDNLHKPPSPKENDVGVDPMIERPKPTSVSSIKPPSMLQSPFVLQQQQKAQVIQSKASPPLVNKRLAAGRRKQAAVTVRNQGSGDSEYQQFGDELSSLSMDNEISNTNELLSPLPDLIENQSARNFSFPSTNQQQVSICIAVSTL